MNEAYMTTVSKINSIVHFMPNTVEVEMEFIDTDGNVVEGGRVDVGREGQHFLKPHPGLLITALINSVAPSIAKVGEQPSDRVAKLFSLDVAGATVKVQVKNHGTA